MKNPLKAMMLIGVVVINSISAYQIAYAIDEPPVTDLTHTRSGSLDQRLTRLENRIANQYELISQLSTYQQQVQELQGQVEVLSNENVLLKQQQLKFYTDIDKRLQALEKLLSASAKHVDTTKAIKTSVIKPLNATDAYQAAFNTVKHKEYVLAIKQFKDFLQHYPASNYVPNAHYWLAEVYLLKTQTALAKQQFNLLVTQYPQHTKVADALFKLALIDYEQGNKIKALEQLKNIQKRYPGTKAAELANAKLTTIKINK